MKILRLTLIFLLFFNFLAYSQSYQWVNKCGTIWNDTPRLSSDQNGHYFLSGFIGNSPSQGYFYFDNESIPYYGLGDILLANIDFNGTFKWAKTFGSHINNGQTEFGTAFYDLYSNSIYVACYIADDDVYFDNIHFANPFPSKYLAKLDMLGNFLWVKSFPMDNWSILPFDQNKLYLVGFSQNYSYVKELDSLGNELWNKNLMTRPYNSLISLFKNNQSLIITGVGLKNCQLDTSIIASSDTYNYFISEFDTTGNIQKYFYLSSPNKIYETYSKISNDKILSALYYTDTINFNAGSLYYPGNAFVLVKHDLNGQLKWIKRIDPTGVMEINSIEYTPGSIYIAGDYDNQFLFDSTQVFNGGSPAEKRGFIIYLDEDGNYKDGYTFPKSKITGILRSNDGKVVFAGTFRDTLQLGGNSLVSYGYDDIFIAKMDSLNTIPEVQRVRNEDLVIYANPNAGTCKLVIPEEVKSTQNLLLIITDAGGKIVYSGKPEEIGNELFINLEQYASGQYFVTLRNGSKEYHGKIVFNK